MSRGFSLERRPQTEEGISHRARLVGVDDKIVVQNLMDSVISTAKEEPLGIFDEQKYSIGSGDKLDSTVVSKMHTPIQGRGEITIKIGVKTI